MYYNIVLWKFEPSYHCCKFLEEKAGHDSVSELSLEQVRRFVDFFV